MDGNFGFQVQSGDRTVWIKFRAHRTHHADDHDAYISCEGLQDQEAQFGRLEPIYSMFKPSGHSVLYVWPLNRAVVLNHNGYDPETLQPYVALLLTTYAAENLR